jgi:ATP-binding cassette subfamily C (CFTR/MRP) protein 1
MADPSLAQRIPVVIAEHDLPAAPRKEPANLANDLERALEKHSGLWTALVVAYGFLQPILLRALLSYISEYQDTKGAGVVVGATPLLGHAITTRPTM